MTVKCILGCVIVALAAAVVAAEEPTTMSRVKTVVIRDTSVPIPETDEWAMTRSARLICIEALRGKLSEAGFLVQDKAEGADAELQVLMNFRGGGMNASEGGYSIQIKDQSGSEVEVTYSIRISSVPGGQSLFSFVGNRTNKLASACNGLAKAAVKKIVRSKAG